MEKKLVIHQVKFSPSSIFSKTDVLRLVSSVDENPIKITVMEPKQQEVEELQRWKQLCHELAACLGCGCTTQTGLCMQCHKANKRYRAVQIPLR